MTVVAATGVAGASGFSVSVADVASAAVAFGRAHVAVAGASVAASGVLAGAAGLDDLVRQLSPEVAGRLERAARFPAPADPPGLTVADVGEVAGLGLRGSGWDQVTGDRLTPDNVVLSGKKRTHILDGDETGGGHRYGTGNSKKTEFPQSWTDDRIIGTVTTVARDPSGPPAPIFQLNNRWKVRGVIDGVVIDVILEKDGRVVTGYPVSGPGVHRNPP